MTSKTNNSVDPSKIGTDKILLEIPSSELLATLNNIHRLQAALSRLASILDNEPDKVTIVSQSALKKFSDEIVRKFARRHTQYHREAVQHWENEGGTVVSTSVSTSV